MIFREAKESGEVDLLFALAFIRLQRKTPRSLSAPKYWGQPPSAVRRATVDILSDKPSKLRHHQTLTLVDFAPSS
jgi:hypothetical protein